MTSLPGLDDARLLVTAADGLLAQALARARAITAHGADIDDHQVLTERVAYAATRGRARRGLFVEFAAEAGREGRSGALLETTCAAGVALLVRSLRERIDGVLAELGLGEGALERRLPGARAGLPATRRRRDRAARDRAPRRRHARPRSPAARRAARSRCARTVREFAEREVAPHAEHIHRHDELVPEALHPRRWPSSATSASRCPRVRRLTSSGNLAMILTTEELSRASLAAAGSLITRPEILTKALLAGGTEEQKKQLAAADRGGRGHGRASR